MEWVTRLEQTLTYIEDHLTEEIDVAELGKIAYCSSYHYQRVFSYMVGVPLAVYIRRRKLSLAGVELQQGAKVIDVAIKYGYESPNSFTRAFKKQHGITPSEAQQEGSRLTSFPRIKFQITIKGDVEMEYRIETKEAFRVIGAQKELSANIEENFAEVPKFWQQISMDGTLNSMLPMMNQEPKGVLGISAGFDGDMSVESDLKGSKGMSYYIAVASDQAISGKLVEYIVPSFTWAIFTGQGAMPHAIQELEKRIVTDWLPSSGYEYANGPDIELYLDANPNNATFEVWLPVTKKE
ncbi:MULTISPECIES: AraC family transcriptional regulator [unclassified Enterococcus]|uniref:AraC family transcriptional regulator n=1 Tax=unclassified Enterococcus TaxID=2608891 RepID=UPI001CE066BA|nr:MULTISPECIES: AraC family transcriptional regulator [unclassified Enterococcus]MCA5011990.1 AraC family transcriptional regulator [Enterococcus sp. S23]MCA5015241.1 AraC family transcriptional regulator [Enterococcus sp. S22(2020)]